MVRNRSVLNLLRLGKKSPPRTYVALVADRFITVTSAKLIIKVASAQDY